MNKELKEICSKCEDYIHCIGKGCAFRSLGNEYCDEVENVNKLINDLQNDLDASNSRAKELSERIIKAIEYINNYDAYKEFTFPMVSRATEKQMIASVDFEIRKFIKPKMLSILKGEPNNE